MNTTEDKGFMLRLEALRPNVEAWLRQYGVPAHEAPELAPAVLDRAARLGHTYDKTRPLEPWLRAIAKNCAADCLTTTILRSALSLKLLQDEAADSTPYHELSRSQIFKKLTDALSELDAETRALLHAHHVEGRRLKDLSEELGIPESTLNKRLIRARAYIREILERDGITNAHLAIIPFALFEAIFRSGEPEEEPSSGARPDAQEPPRETGGPDPEYAGVSLPPARVPEIASPLDEEDDEPPIWATLKNRSGLSNRWPTATSFVVGAILGALLSSVSTCTEAQPLPRIEVKVGLGGATCCATLPAARTTLPASDPTRTSCQPSSTVDEPPSTKPVTHGSRGPADDDEGLENVFVNARHPAGRHVLKNQRTRSPLNQ